MLNEVPLVVEAASAELGELHGFHTRERRVICQGRFLARCLCFQRRVCARKHTVKNTKESTYYL